MSFVSFCSVSLDVVLLIDSIVGLRELRWPKRIEKLLSTSEIGV